MKSWGSLRVIPNESTPVVHYSPNRDLFDLLIDAYQPCRRFGTCREAKWSPQRGHIPRGFLGASGELTDVEVVMVFAEPGHPHHDESHDPNLAPACMLKSGLHHVYNCYRFGTDLFHRNVRWFLSRLYPNLSFDQQLRHVWLTEGRLCSIENETGSTTDPHCARHYLNRELALLPNATVAAFGRKAERYLKHLRIEYFAARALAPPGANHKPARPSWEYMIKKIEERR